MFLREYIYSRLKDIGVEHSELSAEVNFIMENYLFIKNFYIDIELTDDTKIKLDKIFQERKKGLPLQYIIGVADFMGEKFFVNKNTLIPRPETELLVREAIKINKGKTPQILDIGTGSGCIGIMLAKNIPNAKVTSIDISPKAIEVAQKNALKLSVNIEFIHSDLLNNINSKYDIIVSNPPYIPKKSKENIQKEVSFEPEKALYTNDEYGVEFYEKMISIAKNFLNENGCILFELGINQSGMVKKIFMDYNYKNIKIIKDLNNIDRVITARV